MWVGGERVGRVVMADLAAALLPPRNDAAMKRRDDADAAAVGITTILKSPDEEKR